MANKGRERMTQNARAPKNKRRRFWAGNGWELSKFRHLGSYWKVVMPKARTRLEHAEQYAIAMTGLIDAQQALLVTMMNGLGCYDNVKQLIHIYSMLSVGANAVAELRELGNAPRELGAVVTGSILPADIFSDDSFEVVASVPTVLVITTIPTIRDTINTECCALVQLRVRNSGRKRISGKKTWNMRAYKKINMDKTIKTGYYARLKSQKSKAILAWLRRVTYFNGNEEQEEQLAQLIREELNKGKIRVIYQQEVLLQNRTFAINNSGEEFMKIMECRQLNTQLKSQHLKTNNLNKVLEIRNKDDWACLMNIKSAFNNIAITGELDKYLVFTHTQIHYTQVGMSIGISVAPKTFAKTIQITTGRVRNKSPMKKEIEWILKEFRKYGWMINESKSWLKLDYQTVFLGSIKAARVIEQASEMIVTKKFLTELYWWMNQLENNQLKMIDDRQNQVTIQTDASISGWGSKCDQGQCANQKDLRIIGSGQGEFELARDSCETQSRTSAERIQHGENVR
ncbi:MAG: hypothetical protein EZS28_005906 [Streblomastix strix]|uniref:Reverse transcriptase domain-containing protein n=1 Tax=Streblomastix strix TaxID=222440 RepID=A0A5J4WUC4_9EUKA|nr:MAG: hypothetical protein EZS28_005906 [Streblomastix strix]